MKVGSYIYTNSYAPADTNQLWVKPMSNGEATLYIFVDGKWTPTGGVGESAYEAAVKAGFNGSKEEWLDSLALKYSDLTAEQKADLVKDAVSAAERAAQAVENIENTINDIDVSSTDGAITALAAKQGLLENKVDVLGPKCNQLAEIVGGVPYEGTVTHEFTSSEQDWTDNKALGCDEESLYYGTTSRSSDMSYFFINVQDYVGGTLHYPRSTRTNNTWCGLLFRDASHNNIKGVGPNIDVSAEDGDYTMDEVEIPSSAKYAYICLWSSLKSNITIYVEHAQTTTSEGLSKDVEDLQTDMASVKSGTGISNKAITLQKLGDDVKGLIDGRTLIQESSTTALTKTDYESGGSTGWFLNYTTHSFSSSGKQSVAIFDVDGLDGSSISINCRLSNNSSVGYKWVKNDNSEVYGTAYEYGSGESAAVDVTLTVPTDAKFLFFTYYHDYAITASATTIVGTSVIDALNALTQQVNSIEGASDQVDSLLGSEMAKVTAASLSDEESLSIPAFPYSMKAENKMCFSADLTSFGNGFEIRKGTTDNGAVLVKIDATELLIKQNNQAKYRLAHGLAFSSFVKVILNQKSHYLYFKIITLDDVFEGSISDFGYQFNGLAEVVSNGASMTNVALVVSNPQFKLPMWMFGDSYFGADSSNREMYWLRGQWGFESSLFNGFAGRDSAAAYQELQRCLQFGTPKYLLWCLGMNDTTSDYSTYLAQVKQLCEQKGITLILQTIPNVPSHLDRGTINAAVVASGCRYIDAAKAVGADSSGHWYGYGTDYDYLSTDNIHPSEYGARAIAAQFLIDVPEIMQY